MRLIGLHVENFGGLHDYTEVFEAGLNVRLQPNGWGKSTLAVFIKAMLYGLPASTKRSLIENERKRYAPWQGGVFGGSLDIEVGGEAYRIERSFGSKEAEDTLTVLSLRTGGEADVDWAVSPGERLFGVDAAAYERSTYLSQRPDDMTKDGTVSIHTKLNRLVDATDDLANFDSAMAALEKRRRELKHLTGGGGAIAECESRIALLDREIERCRTQRTALQACRERIASTKDGISAARAEAEQVQRELSSELKRREGRAVGARLEALQAEETELRTVLSDCRDALGGQEPTEQHIESLSRAVAARDAAERRISEVHLDEHEAEELQALSARFAKGTPDESELDALRRAAHDYNRAFVLAADAQGASTSEEYADPEEQYLQIRADRYALQQQRSALEQSRTDGPTRKVDPLTVASLALAVLFAVGAIWYSLLWIGTAVCLVVALALAAVGAKRRGKAAALARETEQRIAQTDEAIKQTELQLQAVERAVRFAKLWQSAYPGEPCPSAAEAALDIERLAARGERLRVLSEKKKQLELSRRACRHAMDEAQAHLLTLTRGMKGYPEDTSRLVRWLTELHSRYREALARLERKQAEIAAVQKECEAGGGAPATQQETVDIAALEARQKELSGLLAQQTESLAREEQTEARLVTETEALDELEGERETLALQLEEQSGQLTTIQSAEKYLKLAREQLSGRYLSTMQDSFGRYLSALSGDEAPVFTMDGQFRVKIRAAGLSRDTEAFSVGVRDLIALCERLALLDAMFEGERPFLILDDPFTNLDDDTVDRACALVGQVAQRYQVLYLTCNSSRMMNDFDTKEDENA